MVSSPSHELLMEEAPVSLEASPVPPPASQKDFGTQTWSVHPPKPPSSLPPRDWVLLGAELGRFCSRWMGKCKVHGASKQAREQEWLGFVGLRGICWNLGLCEWQLLK